MRWVRLVRRWGKDAEAQSTLPLPNYFGSPGTPLDRELLGGSRIDERGYLQFQLGCRVGHHVAEH
jgi:hypothetical protein